MTAAVGGVPAQPGSPPPTQSKRAVVAECGGPPSWKKEVLEPLRREEVYLQKITPRYNDYTSYSQNPGKNSYGTCIWGKTSGWLTGRLRYLWSSAGQKSAERAKKQSASRVHSWVTAQAAREVFV
jgi:hypothetical protein